MYLAGRTEAAVFLYGLLILYRNDRIRKELIVDALDVKTLRQHLSYSAN